MNLLEGFTLIILPEGKPGRSPVRKSEIHPAVVIKIEDSDAEGERWHA